MKKPRLSVNRLLAKFALLPERGNAFLRFLDRYFGIPLLFFFSLFFTKKPLPKHIKKIALLKTAGIGDLVLLSGVIRDLQLHFPQGEITLFTGTTNACMGELIEGVVVESLPITRPFKSLRILRKKLFDVFIDCDPWPRINALLTLFSRSSFTIGFRTPDQGRHIAYDASVFHLTTCHEIDNYRRLVAILGISPQHLPQIIVSTNNLNHQYLYPNNLTRYVVFHLYPGGARACLKMWPNDNWIALMSFVYQQNYKIVLTGAHREKVPLDQFTHLPGVHNCSGVLSLKETAALLTTAVCVISVDTGIMHLAAALGCTVIALHGPTSPKRWGALGPRVFSITPSLDYAPCIQLGFEKKCSTNMCMRAISIDQVIAVLKPNLSP